MKDILQIGITGGIGVGKSVVTKIFSVLGIPVYDADTAAKRLMLSDPVLILQIKKELGDESYLPDGTINRTWLSDQAFGTAGKVEKLNSLVHPRVGWDYDQWLLLNNSFPYVIKEAALLFEAGSYAVLDKIIVVTAPEELRIQRVLQRDNYRTEADVKKIIRNQMPEDEKIRRADFVIENDDRSLILPPVLALHRSFSAGKK